MIKLLYSLLLVGTSGGVGLASVVGWLNYKLFKKDRDKRRKSLGLLLLGTLVQNSILTYALIDNGTASLDWRSVLYTIGLAISTTALSWKAGQFTQDLALIEAVHNGDGGTRLWLENVERRLVAEEARNTTIEHYAKSEEQRVSDLERRADETEGHA